jgi:hypothetical protein
MQFEILGEISGIETFAKGFAIREVARLRRVYGRGRWQAQGRRSRSASRRLSSTRRDPLVRSRRNGTQGIQDQTSALNKRNAMTKTRTKRLAVCIDNDGYPAALEKRKIYVALPDSNAEQHGLLRIIDESGEDYLYPKALFRLIDLPEIVRKAVLAAA